MQEVGPEAFDLGLLFGTESDPTEEEQGDMFFFEHMMFLEFVAGKYVASVDKVCFSV